MSHHQAIALTIVMLVLLPLATLAKHNQNVYYLSFFGRRLCCDDVWANGNCPDSENDFNVGVTGATAVLRCKNRDLNSRCKDRDLNSTQTYSGWFNFVFTGNKNPIMKYDLIKECRLIVTNASISDCPNLVVPLVSPITGIPADGIIDYANNGDFSKLN